MTNVGRAREILRMLAQQGVSEVVVCAGARNAPFVALLSQVQGLRVYGFFEERSAGFFALGRMRASGRPVAVCTTSGTAVAELLPAVIEADYQGLPLVVLSADRPTEYRGTGAPQTIVQPGIFSSSVEQTWDITGAPDHLNFSGRRPVHVNVCFAEPLLDEPIGKWIVEVQEPRRTVLPISSVVVDSLRPLVIVSGLSTSEAEFVLPVLQKWQRPVYLEATSQLRGRAELSSLEIRGGEATVSNLDCDSVVRIGTVPTLRFWRDLEASTLPVWHFSNLPWSGLPREKSTHSLDSLSQVRCNFAAWNSDEVAMDRGSHEKLEQRFFEHRLSEAAWVGRVSQWIPENATVFLGNSLPIREWDLAAARDSRKQFKIYANRGVNGIDGLISTFIGLSSESTSNWAVIGDLSALYDLSGPWAARARQIPDLNLVIINNGGGQIFAKMFKTALFENRHDLEFSSWAKMWDWSYQKLQKLEDIPDLSQPGPRVFEIVPEPGGMA